MNLHILKLKMDVCTRWNSTWDMLKGFTERQEPIMSTLALLQIDNWQPNPTRVGNS